MWLSLGMSKSIMALMRETEVRSSAGYCTFRLLRLLYNSVAWWVKTHVNCLHCCWWHKGYTFWHSSYFTLQRRPRRQECLLSCIFNIWQLLGFTHFSHQETKCCITHRWRQKPANVYISTFIEGWCIFNNNNKQCCIPSTLKCSYENGNFKFWFTKNLRM